MKQVVHCMSTDARRSGTCSSGRKHALPLQGHERPTRSSRVEGGSRRRDEALRPHHFRPSKLNLQALVRAFRASCILAVDRPGRQAPAHHQVVGFFGSRAQLPVLGAMSHAWKRAGRQRAVIFLPMPLPKEALQCSSNFMLHAISLQSCSTNCLWHGNGYECHSQDRKAGWLQTCAST